MAIQLVAGLQHDLVEDATDAFVRALEALTKAAGLSRQDLLEGVPPTTAAKVRATLESAVTEIRREAETARQEEDTAVFDRLITISDRARSASQVESKFGLAVSRLLTAKGLNDESVVNVYLGARTPPTTWVQFLSKIRGSVIHEGSLNLPTRKELFEVHFLLRHLGDVIARLLALEIGYTGKYLPTVAEWAMDARELNWVLPSSAPAELRLS